MPEFSPSLLLCEGPVQEAAITGGYTGMRLSDPDVDTHRTLEISFNEDHTCQEGLFFKGGGVTLVSPI